MLLRRVAALAAPATSSRLTLLASVSTSAAGVASTSAGAATVRANSVGAAATTPIAASLSAAPPTWTRGFASKAGGGGASSSSSSDDEEAAAAITATTSGRGRPKKAASGTAPRQQRARAAGRSAEGAAAAPSTPPPPPPTPLGGSRIEAMLHEIESSNRTRARFLMQRILDGREASAFPPLPTDEPEADAAAAAAQAAFLSRFRTRVVDVTRSSKGSSTGGVSRYSAMVVSGNGAGVVGLGTGRAAEVADAVRKATRSALSGASLFLVPRHARTTVLAPSSAWHGSVKASVFPLPTGRGIRASPLAAGVCRLAGLADVGVKLHGARTPRNAVKALIKALEGGPTLAGAAREAAAAGGVRGGDRVRVRELVSHGGRGRSGGTGRRRPVKQVGGVQGLWFA